MPYSCDFSKLLDAFEGKSLALASWLRAHYRETDRGLLSVGLKLHVLPDAKEYFEHLSLALVGKTNPAYLGEGNVYKATHASLCIVLPPVGSADSAIHLLEAISRQIIAPVWGNKSIQVQVCSPGRLSPERTAILGTVFYLGSEKFRTYTLPELETSVQRDYRYMRSPRLVIYDGYSVAGEFDPDFPFLGTSESGHPVLMPRMPLPRGRSDVLMGTAYRNDIRNINLVATLLVHAEHGGYWADLGHQFEQDVRELFDRYDLKPVLDAPWVSIGSGEDAEESTRIFSDALNELVAFACGERDRVLAHPESEPGMLFEIQDILREYRATIDDVYARFALGNRGVAT